MMDRERERERRREGEKKKREISLVHVSFNNVSLAGKSREEGIGGCEVG